MKRLAVNQLGELCLLGLGEIPVDGIDGRHLLSRGRRIVDFCNTNYLGFDFEEKPHLYGCEFSKELGSLFGLSRLEANPSVYADIEREIARLVGGREVILSHTITITNFSVMAALAKKGTIYTDEKVHAVVYESARLARDHGAKIVRFGHQDISDLEEKLKSNAESGPKIICVDGVYSISSAKAPIGELLGLCEKYQAWLYVDDAHGFGMLGKNPSGIAPYGTDGSGILNYHGHSLRKGSGMERAFYVSSFGKSFCTQAAFLSVPLEFTEPLREQCTQYIYSAPISPYVLGQVKGMLELNRDIGAERREKVFSLTKYFVEKLKSLGCEIYNEDFFPIVFWKVGTLEELSQVAKHMLKGGVLAGVRAYPVVPKDGCGLRFGITALHTQEQVDHALNLVESYWKEKRGLKAG